MGYGDEDLARIEEDAMRRPSSGAIIRMCHKLGIEEDDRRTVNTDDAWDYFYELFAQMAKTSSRESLYDSLGSYLFPKEIDGYLSHINQQQRKTA